MGLLTNITSYFRVLDGVHKDQDATPLVDGINFGSPSTTLGDGGEAFISYDGISQYSTLPITAPFDADAVDWTLAVRFKTATAQSTSTVVSGFSNDSDGNPYVALRGSAADSLRAQSRDDLAVQGAQATTALDANLYDGTERIAVFSNDATSGVLYVYELTLGLSGSDATAGTNPITVTQLDVGAFVRSSPIWFSDVDVSWVATWSEVISAQDRIDLATAPWPFAMVEGGNGTVNLPVFYQNPALFRTGDIPAANWEDGMNKTASCAVGVGINTGNISVPDPARFTLLDQEAAPRTPQTSQSLGQPVSGVVAVQGEDMNDGLNYVSATQEAAPNMIYDVATGTRNRTKNTIKIGETAWGTKDV